VHGDNIEAAHYNEQKDHSGQFSSRCGHDL
jgi:hypothetical protein